mgnify:CR=1 FL=1
MSDSALVQWHRTVAERDARRLDSLCREFRQEMLVSSPAYKLLSLELQSKFQTMGEVLFRGKTQPQAVYGQK